MYVLYIICGSISICVYLIIWYESYKNFKLLHERCIRSKILVWLPECEKNIIRSKDFFYMKNDGTNPCTEFKSIEYVDYIENCSIFMER
ncbi:MAG: hypothetical protein IJA34_06655 [Lachnospiraceae bacterium]|nr:hypothetical protein [Lachnospiraceae bacterium]